jgi:hypothetical protein
MAKQYDVNGSIAGSDNWLSDFKRKRIPIIGVPEDVTIIGTDNI